MYLSQKEKKRHPEYEQYIALFEETITQMESGARGRGAPEAIIERCLDKALEFYDADSAALVETNLDLGYGVCVSEHCKTGTRSFEGRIIGVTPEETPCLYEKVMALEVFDVHVQEERGQLSNNEYSMLIRMGVEVFAVAPYLKRYSGYVYIRNPRRFVGLYGFLQAVSYVCASERNEYKLMDNLNVAVSSKECRSEQEVRIKVFGGLSITTKFGSLDESQISSAQAVRLVAYLLMNDTRKVPQNELTNALWPNSEVDAPAKQVRNVVHRTRAILEPIFPDELVSSDRAGNYFINPNITVITDASVFESFCRLAQQPAATFKEKLVYLKRATDIYQNDFLPQYTGDTWLDNQRTFYRLTYLKAVLTLLPMYYQMEKYSEMLSLSSAALLYEPDSGDILFWHIRAMYKLGSLDLTQKYLAQHAEKLSEEQKTVLESILSGSH